MRLLPPLSGLSRRRVLAVVLLVSHALAATGAPIPSKPLAPASGSHPCQGRACGCSTSEHAWGDCCCSTRKEKLAWAAERGISVPAQAKPKKSCCSAEKDHKPATHAASCCDEKQPDSPPPPATVRWLSGVQAQKCRGEGPTGLLKLELVVAPESFPDPLAALVPVALLNGFDCRATSTSHFPPTPPPRVC